MREAQGNLWTYPADVRVITTNGDIDRNGELVMGRGTALQAKERYPAIARWLALEVEKHGNVPVSFFHLDPGQGRIWTFPVKYHWRDDADLVLIRESARKIVKLANVLQAVRLHQGRSEDITIVLPQPGCGNGHLAWEAVRPVIVDLLDDRFVVLTPTTTAHD